MPALLEGLAPLTIEYAVSLPHSLLATMSLLCAASEYEGLGEWLHEARARLDAELLAELCLLITFPGRYQRFTAELFGYLLPEAKASSFEELLSHLRSLPDSAYRQMVLGALARGAKPRPDNHELLDLLGRPGEWAAYLHSVESQTPPETVASLVRDGASFKTRLLAALDRFWRELYQPEFEKTRPQMERSVAYHQAQPYNPDFSDLFVTVTGRLLPEPISELLPSIKKVTCIPSCHVGPYVAYAHTGEHLFLYYNCRSTPLDVSAHDLGSLYPPLKALADETRLQILALLQGRELYAQEIVNQMEISQPAVSRHLNLMAAAGVLKTRRDANAKYYTVNGEALTRLAVALRRFE
jgi:hypothetical protein